MNAESAYQVEMHNTDLNIPESKRFFFPEIFGAKSYLRHSFILVPEEHSIK